MSVTDISRVSNARNTYAVKRKKKYPVFPFDGCRNRTASPIGKRNASGFESFDFTTGAYRGGAREEMKVGANGRKLEIRDDRGIGKKRDDSP